MFLLAVGRRFHRDGMWSAAAAIAAYGVTALVPLLLLLTTALRLFLGNHPSVQAELLDGVLARFPVMGAQMRGSTHSLQGAELLFAGLLGGGASLGAMQAARGALDRAWKVPVEHRSSLPASVARDLLVLYIIAVGIIATSLLAQIGPPLRIVVTAGLDLVVFLVAFRFLTSQELRWKDVVAGAAVASLTLGVLEAIGNRFVVGLLLLMGPVYGIFGLAIAVLLWLYAGAVVTLLSAEVNVVARSHREAGLGAAS